MSSCPICHQDIPEWAQGHCHICDGWSPTGRRKRNKKSRTSGGGLYQPGYGKNRHPNKKEKENLGTAKPKKKPAPQNIKNPVESDRAKSIYNFIWKFLQNEEKLGRVLVNHGISIQKVNELSKDPIWLEGYYEKVIDYLYVFLMKSFTKDDVQSFLVSQNLYTKEMRFLQHPSSKRRGELLASDQSEKISRFLLSNAGRDLIEDAIVKATEIRRTPRKKR
ncbi:hypothetical protein ACFLXB_08225 [Chloroflexota bacterium]